VDIAWPADLFLCTDFHWHPQHTQCGSASRNGVLRRHTQGGAAEHENHFVIAADPLQLIVRKGKTLWVKGGMFLVSLVLVRSSNSEPSALFYRSSALKKCSLYGFGNKL
jgi:hypothetical protein